MAKPDETDAERKKREEEEKKKAEKPEEEEDEEEMRKVQDKTVKDLTSASEMLVSIAGKAKDGTAPDPKAIGKVIDVLMGVKERYPSPKSKKMSATEFVDWARDELKKAAEEEEPKTRVARLARVQDQMKKAQDAFDSGEEQVEVQVGEVHEFSPFASDQMPANGFEAIGARLDALDKKVDALGKSGGQEPEPEGPGWPLDLAPDPATSDDPAISWGRKGNGGKRELWGLDGK